MYAIALESCTPRDVIQRSVTCHPSLFAEKLRAIAGQHENYTRVTHDEIAKRSARRMSEAAIFAAGAVESEDVDAIVGNFSAMIIALHAACELQALPRYLYAAIAERAA